MRTGLRHPGSAGTRAGATPPRVVVQRQDRTEVRIIPFDHVATFPIRGEVGRVHPDVINTGAEGVFVATAIGYGMQTDTAAVSVEVDTSASASTTVDQVTLADVPQHALVYGIRLNPALESLVFPGGTVPGVPRRPAFDTIDVTQANALGLFESVGPPAELDFLFNIVDTGSGRELQNLPIHNIGGLGKTNGERPFRMLAKPLAFLPRSSVRVEVEERSPGIEGTLFIVLHGYKILGAGGVSEDQLRVLHEKVAKRWALSRASASTIENVSAGFIPSNRVVPFDYVATADLTGETGRETEVEVTINVEGEFVATSVGYGLDSGPLDVRLPLPDDSTSPLPIGSIKLADFPVDVLRSGFRIRPDLVPLAFQNGTLTSLPASTIQVLFEPLNLPERVQFLYAIEDSGTGRAWQDEFVHNIAGLGIADGDRPFRHLSWPMRFLPRSTLRLRVREVFGRGRLYVVFHGYKILRAS